jgi:hypothetical protein
MQSAAPVAASLASLASAVGSSRSPDWWCVSSAQVQRVLTLCAVIKWMASCQSGGRMWHTGAEPALGHIFGRGRVQVLAQGLCHGLLYRSLLAILPTRVYGMGMSRMCVQGKGACLGAGAWACE